MDGNGDLSGKQLRVIPYLLGAPSIEEGCKRARVSKGAVYEWLKDDAFKSELRRRREELTAVALETLKAGIAKATATLVTHLDSERENISIRAAESIIGFAQKALEHEDLERRLEAIEERINQQGGNVR